MNREKQIKLYGLSGLVLAFLLSFFVASNFGLIYLFLFFFVVFCGFFLVLIEMYLRVQHNVDNAVRGKADLESKFIVEFNKIEADLKEKHKGEKELHGEIVDFFENLLNYLEENKKESAGIVENINLKLEELKDLQSKTVVLMRQILEHLKDQTLFLKEEIAKLREGQKH